MALLSAATKAFLKKALPYITGAITIITGIKNFRTIQKLKNQDKALSNRIAILNEKLGFLKSIEVASSSQACENLKMGSVDTNAWETTLDFIDTKMSANYTDILEA